MTSTSPPATEGHDLTVRLTPAGGRAAWADALWHELREAAEAVPAGGGGLSRILARIGQDDAHERAMARDRIWGEGEPAMAECFLAFDDRDVSEPYLAAELVYLLFGELRRFEFVDTGTWLVELMPAELTELHGSGWFEAEREGAALSANWPPLPTKEASE